MKRGHQVLLITAFLLFCYLAMMVVHEFGHCLGATATGGKVERVVLHPLAISRTDVAPNPHPLIVAWAGPVLGSLIPLAVLLVFQWRRFPFGDLVRFFAGYCLIANGAYLGIGSFQRIGDAGDILRHGAPTASLWLFGAFLCPAGMWLWNGLGPAFGLGTARGKVEPRAAYVALGLLLVTVVLELMLNGSVHSL